MTLLRLLPPFFWYLHQTQPKNCRIFHQFLPQTLCILVTIGYQLSLSGWNLYNTQPSFLWLDKWAERTTVQPGTAKSVLLWRMKDTFPLLQGYLSLVMNWNTVWNLTAKRKTFPWEVQLSHENFAECHHPF